MILLCFKGVQVASLLFPSPSRLGFRVLYSLSSEVNHDNYILIAIPTDTTYIQTTFNQPWARNTKKPKKKKKSHIHGELTC